MENDEIARVKQYIKMLDPEDKGEIYYKELEEFKKDKQERLKAAARESKEGIANDANYEKAVVQYKIIERLIENEGIIPTLELAHRVKSEITAIINSDISLSQEEAKGLLRVLILANYSVYRLSNMDEIVSRRLMTRYDYEREWVECNPDLIPQKYWKVMLKYVGSSNFQLSYEDFLKHQRTKPREYNVRHMSKIDEMCDSYIN